MLSKDLSLLIHSCGAYSDLWEGQIKMLDRNWGDRDIDAYIVTDTNPHGYEFQGVKILCTGEGTEITERIAAFLEVCESDYILVTLDDYYLLNPVSNVRMDYLVNTMKERNLDYIRIFKLPSDGKILKGVDRLHALPLHEDKSKYYINLYPGIWKKDFMLKTVRERLNAWQYEVSLTKIAREIGAQCLADREDDYVILDVVRKGKLLHKAAKYFEKHPGIYTGNRALISYKHEMKIAVFNLGKRLLPKAVAKKTKKFLSGRGVKFYSD